MPLDPPVTSAARSATAVLLRQPIAWRATLSGRWHTPLRPQLAIVSTMPPMRRTRINRSGALASITLVALGLVACGEKDEPTVSDPAPTPAAFPTSDGTIESVIAKAQPSNELVVAPAGSDYTVGHNRF